MIALTVLTKIPHTVKTLAVGAVCVTQVFLNLLLLGKSFDAFDEKTYGWRLTVGHDVVYSCVLLTSFLVLFLVNRQVR